MATMPREEIYKKVQAVLVDALGVDEEEVTPDAVIRDDLGAESIDFLDIMFRLEKAFGIKIPRGEMIPENVQNDPASSSTTARSPTKAWPNSRRACPSPISPASKRTRP